MTAKNSFLAISAGFINGIYGVIFAVSAGSLLFVGPFQEFISYGISIALITVIVGAMAGFFSEEKQFILGPDTGLIVLTFGMMAIISSMDIPAPAKLNLALVLIFITSIISALILYILAKLNFGELLRYIPFPVIAGYLCSISWLGLSGGVQLVTGSSLSWEGLQRFVAAPNWYQLGLIVLSVSLFFRFSKKISMAILVPIVVSGLTVAISLIYQFDLCHSTTCSREALMFSDQKSFQYFPPWHLTISLPELATVLQFLPAILVISFTAALTNLLSLANVEESFKKEFNPNKSLLDMALVTFLSGLFGGFIAKLSTTRTNLNRLTAATAVSGMIAAGIGLIALFQTNNILLYFPKVTFGSITIYLALMTIKAWLWDIRKTMSKTELLQIVFIIVVVAHFDYMMGFLAGILMAVVDFIVKYNRLPLLKLSSDLSIQQSSTIRSKKTPAQLPRAMRI